MTEIDDLWLEKKKNVVESIREECKKLAAEKNVDEILAKVCHQLSSKRENSYDLSCWQIANIFVPFLRLVLCPHFRDIHKLNAIRKWDLEYSFVLINCIFPSNVEITWGRLSKSILVHDLNHTLPYDGSGENCYVNFILKYVREMIDLISTNDFIGVQRKLSSRSLKYSVLQSLDELGWTLLHHAAYHSSIDCMNALISEGLSPNILTHQAM